MAVRFSWWAQKSVEKRQYILNSQRKLCLPLKRHLIGRILSLEPCPTPPGIEVRLSLSCPEGFKNPSGIQGTICYAPSREFDYLIINLDPKPVIFWLHGLSEAFRNYLKNVKTLEPKTSITILSIPKVISGRNIKGSIFAKLCRPSRSG